jgi:hypothetical protein
MISRACFDSPRPPRRRITEKSYPTVAASGSWVPGFVFRTRSRRIRCFGYYPRDVAKDSKNWPTLLRSSRPRWHTAHDQAGIINGNMLLTARDFSEFQLKQGVRLSERKYGVLTPHRLLNVARAAHRTRAGAALCPRDGSRKGLWAVRVALSLGRPSQARCSPRAQEKQGAQDDEDVGQVKDPVG